MKVKEYPSQKELKDSFYYEEGYLVDIRYNRTVWLNKSNGYTTSRLNGVSYFSHRLIWIWHNGSIPNNLEIDHIDRVRDNNKIENLRVVTHQENMFNKDSDGYYFDSTLLKWYAKVSVNRMALNLGAFDSEEEAKANYEKAKAEILDTLRHYRQTGKVLKNELVNLVVLDMYSVLVKLNGKQAFNIGNINKNKAFKLVEEYVELGYTVEIKISEA